MARKQVFTKGLFIKDSCCLVSLSFPPHNHHLVLISLIMIILMSMKKVLFENENYFMKLKRVDLLSKKKDA